MRALINVFAVSLVACGVNTEPILADQDMAGTQRQAPDPDAGFVAHPPPDGGIESEDGDGPALFDAARVEDPCSDGLEQTCEAEAPECEAADHVATLRGGCWVCVDPLSCPPGPGSRCEADDVWRYACPVAGLSVPWCDCGDDGVVRCVEDPRTEACCGDEEPVVCDAEPEPCPEGTIAGQHAGCWACVDAALCTPPE